jgi:hypothetical protein
MRVRKRFIRLIGETGPHTEPPILQGVIHSTKRSAYKPHIAQKALDAHTKDYLTLREASLGFQDTLLVC